MMMVISKYTKFPDKKENHDKHVVLFFFGWNSFQSHIVRLRNKKARIRLRAFLFLNNPETFGCVVKTRIAQMAAEGEPPSSMSYIVHESTQKYKKKIIQNLADFAY